MGSHRKRLPKKRFPKRFICEPNYMCIFVEYDTQTKTIFIRLETKKDGVIKVTRSNYHNKKNLEPTDKEITKKVIDFCKDFVHNGKKSSTKAVALCAEDLSRVDNIYGLIIWKRKRISPYA